MIRKIIIIKIFNNHNTSLLIRIKIFNNHNTNLLIVINMNKNTIKIKYQEILRINSMRKKLYKHKNSKKVHNMKHHYWIRLIRLIQNPTV